MRRIVATKWEIKFIGERYVKCLNLDSNMARVFDTYDPKFCTLHNLHIGAQFYINEPTVLKKNGEGSISYWLRCLDSVDEQ